MEFVDTHSHLHFNDFNAIRPKVMEDALAAGVTKILCVGTTLDDSQKAIDYAQKTDGAWAAVGVHPHEAESFISSQTTALKRLRGLLTQPKVAAAGEIGLDYYRSLTPKDVQKKAFRAQLEIGLESGLPFSFHVRDAWTDFWQIIDEYQNIKGVVHSFSSGRKQLEAALSRALYIGINGIMTFTRDEAQLEAARQVPLDRLLLETDAPFLTPEPFRNDVCEPKHTAVTAGFLAKLRDEPLEKLAEATTKNAVRLFDL